MSSIPGVFTLIVLTVFSFLHLGSATQESENRDIADVVQIKGVPFIKQKDKFCGPAAMASVMDYYGDTRTQEEIAEHVYTPKLNGALISDMENYARAKGYRVAAVNGNIDDIKSNIDEDTPVILLVDKGKWKVSVPHYYVVYGYIRGGESLILHTGDEGGQEMALDDLDNQWKKMNRLMLIIKQ